jgi:hypothetical protein
LELLKEIAPHMTRAAVLRDPALAAGIGQTVARSPDCAGPSPNSRAIAACVQRPAKAAHYRAPCRRAPSSHRAIGPSASLRCCCGDIALGLQFSSRRRSPMRRPPARLPPQLRLRLTTSS